MATYIAYVFLGVGVLLFLYAWFDKSRRSMPLLFAATMLVMGGLAILQFLGSEAAPY